MKTKRRSTLRSSVIVFGSALCSLLTAQGQGLPPVSATDKAMEMRNYLEASRSEHSPRYKWESVKAFSFKDATVLKDFRIIDGQWEISNNQLKTLSGLPDHNRTILIAPEIEGTQRIEFDVTLLPRPDGRVGDVCIRLNADPQTGSFARGYALIAAQYFNQANVCYRLNIPIARTESSPIIPGKRHRIVLEWRPPAGHLRLYVDNAITLEAWDRTSPLSPDPTQWIGLSTYGTDMIVENLKISSGSIIHKTPRSKPGKQKE